MFVLGIDPGLDGACVALPADGLPQALVVPTITLANGKRDYCDDEIVRWLHQFSSASGGYLDTLAVLEIQRPMPGQGVTSMFSIGRGFGLWRGILAALGIPRQLVQPRAWQKVMLEGVAHDGDPKGAALLVAERLYPNFDLRASPRCRRAHAGVVDALLIACYGQRCAARGGEAPPLGPAPVSSQPPSAGG